MRTHRYVGFLVVALATGCEQLSDLGLAGAGRTPADRDDGCATFSRQVHWTTAHDGVALCAAGAARLIPDDHEPIDVFHVRVVLAPHDYRATAYVANAQLEFADRATVRALAANADVASLPAVIAEPGSRNVIDLYYPRPSASSRVLFAWQVSAASETRELRATISAPDAPLDGLALGTAAHWWFLAGYAWPEFQHRDGAITHRPPRSAAIQSATSAEQRDAPRDVTTECNTW